MLKTVQNPQRIIAVNAELTLMNAFSCSLISERKEAVGAILLGTWIFLIEV